MSPLNNQLDTVSVDSDQPETYVSEMRRVSMGLIYSPGRLRRRRHINSLNSWFRSRFGLHRRRGAQ